MLKSKYIILDRGIPEPVIFSETLNHSDVAFALGCRSSNVLGAGYCYIRDDKYICYGKSSSLSIESRNKVDSDILNRRLGAIDE